MWFDSRPQKLLTMNIAIAPCSSSADHGGEEKKGKERGGGVRGRRGRARVRAEARGVGFMEGKRRERGGCRWRPQPRRHVRAVLSLRTGEEESDRS